MIGVITGRDVLANLKLIWAEFGFLCLARCVLACAFGPKTTFLEIAFRRRQTPAGTRSPR